VTLPGMGLQKPISKWIPNSLSLWLFYLLDNEATRVILTQPLHHCMPVLRNVSRDLQAWRTSWPTCLHLHAKNETNLKLHSKVTSIMSEDSPESRAIIPNWYQDVAKGQ
jgi:hypothetical protein